MIIGRLRPALGVAMLVALTPWPVHAQLSVTPRSTAKIEICDTCSPQARLPVTIAGAAQIKVTVMDVMFGNQRSAELTAAVSATIEKEPVPSVAISVADRGLRGAGTYTVILEFSAEQQKPVELTVNLERPAASLQSIGPILIERVRGAPWTEAAIERPALVLRETSNRAGLTRLGVMPPNPPPVTGTIDIDPVPIGCGGGAISTSVHAVPAGETRCLHYRLAGSFPPGSTRLTQAITAPELASGLSITFDVRSRLARWYVIVFIALGLVLSFIVKVWLQKISDVAAARLVAIDLATLARHDLQKNPDPVFAAAIREHLDRLDAAIAETDIAAMTTARSVLENSLRQAREDLAKRRLAVQPAVDALRSVVETPWTLPRQMLVEIDRRKAGVWQLVDRLDEGYVSEAELSAPQMIGELADGLGDALTEWQEAVPGFLGRVMAAPRGVSPEVAAAVGPEFTSAKSAVGSAAIGPDAPIETIVQRLSEVARERQSARRAMIGLVNALEQEAGNAAALLDDPAVLSAVRGAIDESRARLLLAVDDPQAESAAALASLTAVHDAWHDTLVRRLPNLDQAARDHLQHSRYLQAVTAALAPAALESRHLAAVNVIRVHVTDTELGSSPMQFQTIAPGASSLPALAPLRARSLLQLGRAALARTAIAALMAVLIGYGLFAPKFIGDYPDFLVIFFWAFGLDLTIEAVSKLAPASRS